MRGESLGTRLIHCYVYDGRSILAEGWEHKQFSITPPTYLFTFTRKKHVVLYTYEWIIPTLFSYFLPFWYILTFSITCVLIFLVDILEAEKHHLITIIDFLHSARTNFLCNCDVMHLSKIWTWHELTRTYKIFIPLHCASLFPCRTCAQVTLSFFGWLRGKNL